MTLRRDLLWSLGWGVSNVSILARQEGIESYVLRNLHTLSPRTTGLHNSRINSYARYKDKFLFFLKKGCWGWFCLIASFYDVWRARLKNSSPWTRSWGDPCLKHCYKGNEIGGFTDCSKRTFLQNKCMFSFHRAQLTGLQNNLLLSSGRVITTKQLLEAVSTGLIIHHLAFLAIRSGKHCYPQAAPTGSLTLLSAHLCTGGFSVYCLNTGTQVFQIAAAVPAENATLIPISFFHQTQQSKWIILKCKIIGHAVRLI